MSSNPNYQWLYEILHNHHHLPTEKDIKDVWYKNPDSKIMDTATAKAAIVSQLEQREKSFGQQIADINMEIKEAELAARIDELKSLDFSDEYDTYYTINKSTIEQRLATLKQRQEGK